MAFTTRCARSSQDIFFSLLVEVSLINPILFVGILAKLKLFLPKPAL